MARRRSHSGEQSLFPDKPEGWQTHGLFSAHYIRSRLPAASLYVSEQESRAVYEKIKDLWQSRWVGLVHANEDVMRQEFLDKVLDWLGFKFIPSQKLPGSQKELDYLLCASQSEKDRALASNESGVIYGAAVGLVEAKKANHPLDAVSKTETPGQFPHEQVQGYLKLAVEPVNGRPFFRWAILTNGNFWRLYCRDAHPGAYFQFHLAKERLLCEFEEFRAFHTLFQVAAFVQKDGRCFLDEVREQAIEHRVALEEDLRRRVYRVVEDLANGFWEYPENRMTEADLPALYEACLILLYRLLFVSYAESRGLLPVRESGPGSNKHYRDTYSLRRLIPDLKNEMKWNTNGLTTLYGELSKLFHLISGEQPRACATCGVPPYNGGLFAPEGHPNLEKWKMGDAALATVLRELVFSEPTARRGQRAFEWGPIDYADLEVRQLGDIYEGLIGGHLVKEGDRLELRNERGTAEVRAVTYTPDHIVRFLVEKTLGPLIREIDNSPEVKRAVASTKRDDSFANRLLALKAVDPAMGSGHFLVRATEWLADQIVYHPTTEIHTERVGDELSREQILAKGKIPVSPGLSQEQAEIAHWRRRVVESCICGVDCNPLAVELSKLALWLTCIASDEPLSFLDHHLRRGNSLVGARLDRLGSPPVRKGDPNLPLPFSKDVRPLVRAALQEIAAIEQEPSASLVAVKGKERRLREGVLERLAPLKRIGNVWVAILAGVEINPADYPLVIRALLDEKSPEARSGKAVLRERETQVDERTEAIEPFHWELEFPDVFFEPTGEPRANPGFDAVIGNPPYVSTQGSEAMPYRVALEAADGFHDDLYVHFIVRSFELLRQGGRFGFITSDTFFTLNTKQRVRDLLQAKRLVILCPCDPFKATVDAAMIVAANEKPQPEDRLSFVQARYSTEADSPERALDRFRDLDETRLGFSADREGFRCAPEAFPVDHAESGCLRVHRTSVEPYRRALKGAFFEPSPRILALHNRLMAPMKRLVDEWWDAIETSRDFAKNMDRIRAYHKRLKPGDVTLTGLICEGGQGLCTANNGRFLGYLEGSPQAVAILHRRRELLELWKRHSRVGPVLDELLKKHSNDFESVVEPLKGQFDWRRDLRLQKGEVYRVALANHVADPNGWTAKERRAAIEDGLSGKRAWVPFRKGDPKGNRWTDDEPLLIDWRSEKVAWLWTHSGRSEPNMPVIRNALSYFTEGITWSRIGNHVAMKARLSPKCVFDTNSSRLTPVWGGLSVSAFLSILNSDLASFVLKRLVKNTQDYEIGDLRQFPLVIPDARVNAELAALAERAIEAKRLELRGAAPSKGLIAFCSPLPERLAKAPAYLRPQAQRPLFHSPGTCLEAIELAVNWAVERLYGVEGMGPFDEF
ncbi:MAG: N-6 DNA methylase [Planctomycetes bacterium]|nr:N-6 DNA methylase [Planctomycetota bacterium]